MEDRVLKPALAGLFVGVDAFASAANVAYGILTFFQEYIPRAWQERWRGIAGLAEQNAQNILDRAGRLAAGMENTVQASGAPTGQLRSVFCGITSADKRQAPGSLYWPVRALELEGKDFRLFPGAPLPAAQVRAQYAALWKQFLAEAGQLARSFQEALDEDLELYLESLLLLLQRYTWCVPSVYAAQCPDVSAYDHARTTAALAVLLSGPHGDDPTCVGQLVGGDITGVQSFIYTISARGATSALRGRSFYLQLLTELVARYTLRELDLPITNLIYAGGGNFFLLAGPAAPVAEVQRKVGEILLRHHHGDLYLALDSVPLHEADLLAGKTGDRDTVSDRWYELARRLQNVKLHRFRELGADLYEKVFQPSGSGDPNRLCQVCGGEHHHFYVEQEDETEQPVHKCWPCHTYEELGDNLRDAAYLVLEKDAPLLEKEREGCQEVFHDLGWRVSVCKRLPEPGDRQRVVLALTDAAYAGLHFPPRTAVGRRFTVNVAPLIRQKDIDAFQDTRNDRLHLEGIKPFSLLEKQSRGIPRLGILRMDVDDLSVLFEKGFGKDATLARIASLSFAISLYFEGWVARLAKDINAGPGGSVYAIYSGGDDLFFVGSWDRVVELARRIRRDLSQYAALHPGIHASAGIVLTGGKYPLAQAAEAAARAEHQAKEHRWQTNGQEHKKDSLSFLGQALDWQRFGLEDEKAEGFTSAALLAHYLDHHADLEPVYRRLISFQEMYHQALEQWRERQKERPNGSGGQQTLWGPWNWLSFYTLTRLYKPTGSQDIRVLSDTLKNDNFASIEWIGLAARWAELLHQGKSPAS